MPTVNYSYQAEFNPDTYRPVFDPTGTLAANLVSGEKHTLTAANGRDFHFIVPLMGPFFGYPGAVSVVYQPTVGPAKTMVEGVDYLLAFEFIGATRGCSKPVFGGISFINTKITGVITLAYRTLGGNWTISLPEINKILSDTIANPRVIAWEQVINNPATFPVIDHEWNLVDMVGASAIVTELSNIALAIANKPVPVLPVNLQAHIDNFSNPHLVTKEQLGLGLVQNFAVATEAQVTDGTATNLVVTPAGVKAAIVVSEAKSDGQLDAHTSDKSNPHAVTKTQVGLGLVKNYDTATNAEAITGTATNLYMTPASAKAALDSSVPVATDTAKGKVALNNGLTAGDDTNANDALTAAGLNTMLQAGGGNAVKSAVKGSLAGDYAALAGSSTQTFDVKKATAPTHAVNLGQLQDGSTAVKGTTGEFSSNVKSGGQFLAAQGVGSLGGYSFTLDAATDTGMFSPGDGILDFYNNGVKSFNLTTALATFYKPITGASASMSMAQDAGATKGSFICKASGAGDANLAGMTFWNDAYAIKLGVRADGYFGLGGWSRAPWSWYVDPGGNMVAGGNVTAYSDPRLKENIRPIESATEKVKLLNGVYFTWKDIAHVACKAGKLDIGVLANEVEEVFPEIVADSIEIEGVRYKTVAYDKLVPVLIEAIKELSARIDTLEREKQ